MRELLLSSLLYLLMSVPCCVSAGDVAAGDVVVNDVHDVLKREAESGIETTGAAASKYPYFYEIKDASDIVARLNLTKGAFWVDLVKTGQKDSYGQIKLEMNGRKIKSYGNFSFYSNITTPTITSKNSSSGLEITFSYKDIPEPESDNKFSVSDAELKFTVQTGPSRKDYWNITSVSLTMKASVDDTDTDFNVDLTPKFSYSGRPADSACGTGYGICAPVGLCWSCNDQVLQPNKLSDVGEGQWTVMWHMPGMLLEPEWGPTKTVSADKFKFTYNWDCDPLIPLSLWVSILITLFLASILFWALSMLSAMRTPTKWDDPKKPGIQVAQTE